jgi:hypothetical protein
MVVTILRYMPISDLLRTSRGACLGDEPVALPSRQSNIHIHVDITTVTQEQLVYTVHDINQPSYPVCLVYIYADVVSLCNRTPTMNPAQGKIKR